MPRSPDGEFLLAEHLLDDGHWVCGGGYLVSNDGLNSMSLGYLATSSGLC